MLHRRRAPPEGDVLLRDVAAPLPQAKARRHDFDGSAFPRRRAVLELSMSRRHLTTYLIDIDITDDGEHGVVGTIPARVERHELRARERPQLGFIAHAPAPDAMLVEQRGIQRFDGHRRGGVPLALRLLDDHFEFARQLLGVDDRPRVRVELNLESLHERRRRQYRVVRGVIVDRVRVEITAVRLRFAGDLPDAARRRALEEHVLQHVRDTDHVVRFVEIADLHVGDDGHHWCRRIATHEQREAVGQHVAYGLMVQRERIARPLNTCGHRKD